MRTGQHAFTLIELLVVVAILATLVGILVPSLNNAREIAKATICMTNLRGIGQALLLYQVSNNDFLVPSYNMPKPGTSSVSSGEVLDGWAAILDHDGLAPGGWKGPSNNIFYCPNTLDIDGMAGGQTGYDQDKPSGYQDWPLLFLTSGGDGATKGDPNLPVKGYDHQIRCGYWLNANNPIGTAPKSGTTIPTCTAYTQCVGFGPFANGNLPQATIYSVNRPSAMIVACDGMYMGRQSVTRLGEQHRRVAYRHPGPPLLVNVNGANRTFTKTVTNTVFADGHAGPIWNNDFPHSNVPAENSGRFSLLANK